MQRVLSRVQMREFDRLATEQCHVPSSVLMENAGRGAADAILRVLAGLVTRTPSVAVVCGGGNNGGDGYVAARRLLLSGVAVEVIASVPERLLKGDALANCRALLAVGGRVRWAELQGQAQAFEALHRADLVVDALFGTGLQRPVEGDFKDAIERMNAAAGRRVSLDIPSGIDADTGAVLGVAVRADLTVTFAAYKPGLLTPTGLMHTGPVEVADIGVPLAALPQVGESALLLANDDIARALPVRAASSHKGSAGRVLVIAGSPGKIGAALLVGRGALRGGAGLVTLAGPAAVAGALDQRVLEAMTGRFDPADLKDSLDPLLARTDVVAIGPGLGLSEEARGVVDHVVIGHAGTVVVDADAITLFQGRAETLGQAHGRRILTPHPAELGRLLGVSAAEVEADRYSALTRAVELTRATILLKGPHTLVGSPGLPPFVGRAGTSALSTGGAGDVLTGLIAAYAAILEPASAAFVGAFLHARAAELWAEDSGADRGLLAHEVADWVPRARAELSAVGGRSTV